jgi:hypothetical protein
MFSCSFVPSILGAKKAGLTLQRQKPAAEVVVAKQRPDLKVSQGHTEIVKLYQ